MRTRAFALVAVAAAGCASFSHVSAPPLVASQPSAEVDALVAAFYGDARGDLPHFYARAEEVIARHPGDGRAHEVAAYAALLLGDSAAVTRHFIAAAADLRSDATALYLWEMGSGGLTPHEADSLRALLEELARAHPSADVRALATFRLAALAEREARIADAARLAGSLAFVKDWLVLGALDNDQGKGFLTEYAPEKSVDPNAEIGGPLVPLRWRVVHANRTGRVDLDEVVWPKEGALAYLATWVHSDADRPAQLRITSDSAVRAWCNDGLVLSEELIANGDLDNLVAPVALHRGWNKLLVKSANRHGDWSLQARLTADDGSALAGLTYATTPQAYVAGPGRDDPSALAPAAVAGPDNRRHFLAARLLARAGQSHSALSAQEEFLSAAPKNLLASYFGALGFWDNEELGRAIDLLNAGVAESGGAATAFLVKRARYYMQKHLVEKAQTDLLTAIARAPANRSAQMELASLYAHRGWQVDRCRTLDELLRAAPGLAWAEGERGVCAEALGYDEEARRHFDRVLRAYPGDRGAHERKLGMAWKRLDFGTIRSELATLRRLDPELADHVLGEGDLARRRGDFAGARRHYEEAARMIPEWPRPRERLANLAYESGHRDEALAAWKDEHARDPNNAQVAQRIEFLQPTKLGILSGFIPDDAAIEEALQKKPTKSPGSASALLLDDEVTEVHADGSSQSVATSVQVAFTDQGRDAMTHQQLARGGDLKVLRAYAISEKGDRQEASSIRGGDVRFRNLQIGSKVVLQYIAYQPPAHFLPGAFVADWFFQSVNQQHEGSSWTLIVPSSRTLHTQVIGPVEKKEETREGYKIYRFSATALPPLVKEAAMPPPYDLLAQVGVSTVDGWDDYVRWEGALLTEAFRTDDKLDALIDGLVKGATSPREKLDRLFHYVTQDIRYQQDYETTIAGVRPHAATAVIERGYGDCKDKAVLLIQMARRVGLGLRFAILRTTTAGKVRRDVPDQQFNHAIVYVPKQKGIDAPFFLDPTSDGLDMGNLRADDQGATSLVMDPETRRWEFIEIPYQAPDLQFDHHKIRIAIKSPTEATASDDITIRGMFAMAVRHLMRNEAMAKKMYEGLSSLLFPGTTLKSGKGSPKEDTHEPVTLSFDIDVSNALQAEDEDWRIRLPGTFELAHIIDLQKRETPLRLGPPSSSHVELEATLPAGYKFRQTVKDYDIEHGCFALKRQSHVEERRLVIDVDYKRRCTEIPASEYAAFRTAVQRGVQRFQDSIAFTKAATR